MGQGKWAFACALGAFALGAWLPSPATAAEAEATPAAKAAPKTTLPRAYMKYSGAEAEQRIEEALDQPLKAPLDYVETPLNQIMMQISEDFDIPILFDTAALDAVASSPEVEVTINIRNTSLRSALELMLKSVEDLAYIVDHEVLLITTRNEADKRLEVRIYRVEDLQAIRQHATHNFKGKEVGPPRLANVVERFVWHETWAVNGTGEGEVEEWPGMLIVCNTRRVQQQVQSLLDSMRSVKDASPPADSTGAVRETSPLAETSASAAQDPFQ